MPGSPNFAHAVVTTINDAIPEARSRRPSGGRATVLVNPGIYQENVLLGQLDDHIDLVGVDRGADENFRFTDKISLNGTQTVEGKEAFRRITKVILPPGSSGERVSVGTSNKLGLTSPLAQKSDFLQLRRNVGSVYEVQSPIPEGDIDTDYHTVKVPLSGVGNALELVYLTI
ncbi:MAG: hypothetical protein AB1725_10600 [Armatimonadota bacterium]